MGLNKTNIRFKLYQINSEQAPLAIKNVHLSIQAADNTNIRLFF